jgi:thiamine biosynthesis lipoprotein
MPPRPPLAELRRARPLLGTLVEITAAGASSAVLARAVTRAFVAIEQVQGLLSFHDPASDLARLNQAAPGEWVRVHPLSWTVLRHARSLARVSGGRFDAAIAPRLQVWGLLPRTAAKRLAADSPPVGHGRRRVTVSRGPACGSAALEFAGGSRVRLAAPLTLDLGGIAKGYAVDRAMAVLRRAGVRRGVVNAGGDLRVFGDAAVPVQVRHPGQPGVFFALGGVRGGALASSALTYSARRWRGRDVGALVDPRTGQACGHGVSITVWARSAWLADGLTKVVASSLAELGLVGETCAPAPVAAGQGPRTEVGALLARYRARAVVIDAVGRATWLGAVNHEFIAQAHVA